MVYFDSDVLVNYLVVQDTAKNKRSIELYREASVSRTFFCSLLCLQETAFVLAKLEVTVPEIEEMVEDLLTPVTINYTVAEYRRAVQMARKIGFQHINDCLHTAIAETHCVELYTFNKSDFKKIRKLTDLKITIL